MNFRLFTLSGTLLIAVAFFFSACTKEGPAGPAGATGPAGPAGPTGATGVAGPAGTANVIYSNWTDTVTYFLLSSPPAPDTIIGSLLAPKLTADIIDKGEIKVYANLNTAADPVVVPLPLQGGFFLGSGGFIDVDFSTGEIDLISNRNIDGLPLRYILIPGGTSSGRMATIDWNNYNEVKTYLGLKD